MVLAHLVQVVHLLGRPVAACRQLGERVRLDLESSFDTDRGMAVLPAWRCDMSDALGQLVVLDAAVVDRAWTPDGLPEDYRFMGSGTAVLEGDPLVLAYRFHGSPRAYTDYPDVRVLEKPAVVVVAPRAVDRPDTGPRTAHAELRDVRIRLAEPLGNRVMVTIHLLDHFVWRVSLPEAAGSHATEQDIRGEEGHKGLGVLCRQRIDVARTRIGHRDTSFRATSAGQS